jgi:hypothetical protein
VGGYFLFFPPLVWSEELTIPTKMQLLLKPTGLCRAVGEKGFRAGVRRSHIVNALSHPNQNYGSWDFDQVMIRPERGRDPPSTPSC